MPRKHTRSDQPGPDPQAFVATLALAALGIVMVYSASFAKASEFEFTGHDSMYFLKRQAIALLIGLGAMWLACAVPLRWVRKSAYLGLGLTVALLVGVLVVGVEVHGARRWFDLGPVRFQPSELAKVMVIVAAARFFATRPNSVRRLGGLVAPIAMTAVVAVLIVLEHDLGTAVMLVLGLMVVFNLGGARLRDLAVVGVGAAVVAGVFVLIEPYRLDRILSWLRPEEAALGGAYQMNHSQMALGSGMVFGRGLCESLQKFFYLPAASTDCIFAILGEELGFAGCIVTLGLFAWLGYRGMAIAHRTDDAFAALLAAGIAAMLMIQVALNVAVVTGTIPTTGLPLPMISYGGSGLVLTLLGIGLILNVSRQRPEPEVEEKPRRRTILHM